MFPLLNGRSNFKKTSIYKKKQLNINSYIYKENITNSKRQIKENFQNKLLTRKKYQDDCFLPENFNIKKSFILLEIKDTKLLNKIKDQIRLLAGRYVTNKDLNESEITTISLIVTDHNKMIRNIEKKEVNICLPGGLSKIGDVNSIPICPAHYFQSYLNTVLKKNKDDCHRVSSNVIFLVNNFIKIQHKQNVEGIKFYQTDNIDCFVKLNVYNNFLVSAFSIKTINNFKYKNRQKKFLHSKGYCQFCKMKISDRFNHCDDNIHKYNLRLKKSLFDELDKEIGYFNETVNNDLQLIVPFDK
ncbi:Hypothetical protein SRAE_1000174400 [Strongyloides ratti]|uniref:DBF4-type domain-containing protein n=1 Tax=Strongyloides ratti TaxID=34506 RepID=A0A090MW66_STRRB|nr:Hypothetical protein SRAE_1000174400 [Strongyloides ratti]CEF63483.1 Hypothetical protein SRAE_1000174400 [Strongyloides ratti]